MVPVFTQCILNSLSFLLVDLYETYIFFIDIEKDTVIYYGQVRGYTLPKF